MKFVKEIITNAYMIKVGALWEANTNIQWCNLFSIHMFITSCWTSYFTKIGKTITNEFETIIKKSENGNFYAKQND